MERIQSITAKGARVRIILEDGRQFTLKKSDMPDFPWHEGCDANEEQLLQFVRLRQFPDGLNTAVTMLARRACSRKEITDRLRQQGISDEVSELVIYKLEKENLLNDRDFSDQWTRYRSTGHYGPSRIYRELRIKGVDDETAREAVSCIDDEAQMRQAVDLASRGFRKAKPGEDPAKVQQRVLRMLVQRGFDWDIAKSACSRILSGDEQ